MLQAIFSWYNTSSSVECTDIFCQRESPIQPVTGSNTNSATYPLDRKLFSSSLGKGNSRITFTLTLQEAKDISALHTRRSIVPRENGLQHLRSVILLYNYLSSSVVLVACFNFSFSISIFLSIHFIVLVLV